MGWPRRVLLMALVVLAVGGLSLLVIRPGSGGGKVAAVAKDLSAEQLAAARRVLDKRGVSYEIDSGRLMVSEADVDRVRALLAEKSVLASDPMAEFERLAGEGGLWLSEQEQLRRRLAARMAILSRLIGDFPAVRRSTVILVPGRPRRLGAAAVPSTAAVQVCLEDGQIMTATLVRAIAVLVAASSEGTAETDVRVIDARRGRSFRLIEGGGVLADGVALSEDPQPRVVQAAPAVERPSARASGPTRWAWTITGAVLVVTSVVLGWLLLRRRRRRRVSPRRREDSAAGLVPCDRQISTDVPSGPAAFEFLGDIPPEELVGFVQGEHPQTLALILAHVPSRMAAQMLAVLPRDKQVEVSRRVVDLEQIDPEMVAEIEQALSARLAEGTKWQPVLGGLTSIAQILHHAGYATERTVLEALATQQPALADRIRRRLFAFEDLAATESADLRDALSGFEHSDLAVALRTASKDLKRKILSSLAPGSARRVRREMDRIGPVRLSDVEAAQQRIVDAVRGLGGQRGSQYEDKAGTQIIA